MPICKNSGSVCLQKQEVDQTINSLQINYGVSITPGPVDDGHLHIVKVLRCPHVENHQPTPGTNGIMAEEKVNKKKQKALAFRKSKEEREKDKADKAEKAEKAKKLESTDATSKKRLLDADSKNGGEAGADGAEPVKKKRKTRRGKKGKGVNGGLGPRFILFVGNLPYDIQQAELVAHFKNANPDRIRIRKEKGIAFLEFDHEGNEIQSKMDHALGMHHSTIRKRKINVELTVGGGGNSDNRTQKLKEKNEKLDEERKKKLKKEEASKRDQSEPTKGMHPARAALLKQ